MTTSRDIADDLRLLRHPPGTAQRELEEWLASERSKDAKAVAAAKKAKQREKDAIHLAKSAHGQLKALQVLMTDHLAPTKKNPQVAEALAAGQRWRDAKKSGADVGAIRRFRSQAYRPGLAETTAADRTRRRRP